VVRSSRGRCRTGAVVAAAVLLAGCGGAPDDREARAVALKALAAYADGDARTLCELTPAAKKAQLQGTTCTRFYRTLFVQQSGQDAIDQAMRAPYRPGPVTSVERDGDRTIVTVAPMQLRLTPLQRRGLKLRYGRNAMALMPPAPVRVTVTREDGRLVAGF
jgi:hypothetical protein